MSAVNEQEVDAKIVTLLRDMKSQDPIRYSAFTAELRAVLAISAGLAALQKEN